MFFKTILSFYFMVPLWEMHHFLILEWQISHDEFSYTDVTIVFLFGSLEAPQHFERKIIIKSWREMNKSFSPFFVAGFLGGPFFFAVLKSTHSSSLISFDQCNTDMLQTAQGLSSFRNPIVVGMVPPIVSK